VAAGGVRVVVPSLIPQDRRNKKETQGEWTHSQSAQSAEGMGGVVPCSMKKVDRRKKLNIISGGALGRGPLVHRESRQNMKLNISMMSGALGWLVVSDKTLAVELL
jgi:hypothetical protein